MLLQRPSMVLPLKFNNRLCIEKKSCDVSESCFSSAKQTNRQSIDQLISQAINHFNAVIFDTLKVIVIESKWCYHIYRLLSVSLKLLYTTAKMSLQRLGRERKFLVLNILFLIYGRVPHGWGPLNILI